MTSTTPAGSDPAPWPKRRTFSPEYKLRIVAEYDAAPNASAAALDHPGYPSRHGSTTRPSAGNPHHKPHSFTTVSLDLKSSGPAQVHSRAVAGS